MPIGDLNSQHSIKPNFPAACLLDHNMRVEVVLFRLGRKGMLNMLPQHSAGQTTKCDFE